MIRRIEKEEENFASHRSINLLLLLLLLLVYEQPHRSTTIPGRLP